MISTRILTLVMPLVLLFSIWSWWPTYGQKRTETTVLAANEYLDSLRSRKSLPGLSAAIAMKGKIVWSNASGYTDLPNKVPATPNTIYRIASVSKVVTIGAMLKMLEDQTLALDQSIDAYLDFPQGKNITLRHLAAHTAGIRHYYYDEREDLYPHFSSVSEAINVFKNDPLESQPGDKYGYSSYGIDLIGAIIEKQSGMTFEDYVRKTVLNPLNMSNTFFQIPQGKGKQLSKFYEDEQAEVAVMDLSYNIPGGGMYSTVEDLAKYGAAYLDGTFISEDLKSKTFTKSTLNNGEQTTYGLGWIIQDLDNGQQVYYHDGHMDGTHSVLLLIPEMDLSIAMISNRGSNWGATEALELACLYQGEQDCPSVVLAPGMDPAYIQQTFQNLSMTFANWQTSTQSKDRNALASLIASDFNSKQWPSKHSYLDFLVNQGSSFTLSNQDISLKGLADGDKAYIRTLQFDNYQSEKNWYLVLRLEKGDWQIIGMEAFK